MSADRRQHQRSWEAFLARILETWEPWPADDPDAVRRLRLHWETGDGQVTDEDLERSGYVRREAEAVPGRPARGPGRPAWDRDTFWEHYREAEANTSDPPRRTQTRIAANFRTLDGHVGIDPDTLKSLRRRFSTG